MEHHHSRRTGTPSDDWGVAGICDLVAAGDVQQDEKIKTAGRMPAILKYNFLYD
jgi:hypothetical protein